MCNRARFSGEPETIFERFGGEWLAEKPMDNRFDPKELRPFGRAYVVRNDDRRRGLDVMEWDVLAGQAKQAGRKVAQTNVRTLHLPQWRSLVTDPANRCLIPLTEFCEWAREPTDLGDGKKPIKGEMWFGVTDQPVFAIADFLAAGRRTALLRHGDVRRERAGGADTSESDDHDPAAGLSRAVAERQL